MSVDVEGLELHDILREGARLVSHNIVNLPQFLVEVAGLHLGKLLLAAAKLILAKDFALEVPNHFDSHIETDGDEGGEADEPTAPGGQPSHDNVLIVGDVAFVLAVEVVGHAVAQGAVSGKDYLTKVATI